MAPDCACHTCRLRRRKIESLSVPGHLRPSRRTAAHSGSAFNSGRIGRAANTVIDHGTPAPSPLGVPRADGVRKQIGGAAQGVPGGARGASGQLKVIIAVERVDVSPSRAGVCGSKVCLPSDTIFEKRPEDREIVVIGAVSHGSVVFPTQLHVRVPSAGIHSHISGFTITRLASVRAARCQRATEPSD